MVTEIQNKIDVTQSSIRTFEIPNWDQLSLDKLRDDIIVIASTVTDTKRCFGDVDEVGPIAHFLGAAAGWGGNPPRAAIFMNVNPEMNEGKAPYRAKEQILNGLWAFPYPLKS